ncbi:isochorismatase family protein [Nostoc sp.]|uniref:isochorismatase family protein n=1 Tax=Nostoc sp. TaxID=1180 RepID=UPI002FF87DD9
MTGVTTDICLYFLVISALAEGYEIYAVYDASGFWDMMSQLTSCMRLQQAGAIICNWTVIAAMLQRNWRRPTAEGSSMSSVVICHFTSGYQTMRTIYAPPVRVRQPKP